MIFWAPSAHAEPWHGMDLAGAAQLVVQQDADRVRLASPDDDWDKVDSAVVAALTEAHFTPRPLWGAWESTNGSYVRYFRRGADVVKVEATIYQGGAERVWDMIWTDMSAVPAMCSLEPNWPEATTFAAALDVRRQCGAMTLDLPQGTFELRFTRPDGLRPAETTCAGADRALTGTLALNGSRLDLVAACEGRTETEVVRTFRFGVVEGGDGLLLLDADGAQVCGSQWWFRGPWAEVLDAGGGSEAVARVGTCFGRSEEDATPAVKGGAAKTPRDGIEVLYRSEGSRAVAESVASAIETAFRDILVWTTLWADAPAPLVVAVGPAR